MKTLADLRRSLEHEDNLINHRIGALLGSQAFFFTTLAISLNAPAQFAGAHLHGLHLLLPRVVPWLSLATLGLVTLSLFAATVAMGRLRRLARTIDPADGPDIQGGLLTRLFGLWPLLAIPFAMAAVWVAVLAQLPA